MASLSRDSVSAMGFSQVGANVQVSDRASIYGAENISIGKNVRIDDFVVLSAGSGGIEIGNNVHIAVFSSLIGAEKIHVSDFANISSRVSVYSSSDDFSGSSLTNPTVPETYKDVKNAPVSIGRHVIIGSGCVILPGVSIGDGAAIGALSLVTKSCKSFSIYVGIPAKYVKDRKQSLLEMERAYLNTNQ